MRNQRTPRDICIDQGFNFTHTLLFSLAVIQGLLAKLLIPSSLLDGSNTPRAAFLMKPPWPASSPFPWLSLCCRHRITVLQAVLSIPVNMYVFANELLKRDHLMGSFPCRQRFIMTWCFKSLNPSQRLRPLFLHPVGYRRKQHLHVNCRQILPLPHDRRLAHPSSQSDLLSPYLLVYPPPFPPSDFTLVFTPASNHHVAKTFSFYLDFYPLSAKLVQHVTCVYRQPVFACPHAHPLMALGVLIKSWLSLSKEAVEILL